MMTTELIKHLVEFVAKNGDQEVKIEVDDILVDPHKFSTPIVIGGMGAANTFLGEIQTSDTDDKFCVILTD